MPSAAVTYQGRRKRNEDAVFATDGLLILADGVGGQGGGEQAAQIAVGIAVAHLPARSEGNMLQAISSADESIRRYQHETDGHATASCTLTILAVRDRPVAGLEAVVANVGDSPAFLIRNGTMNKLTEAHTVAHTLLREGRITEVQFGTHTGQHTLTRAIGGMSADPDLASVELHAGDRLLVCSDGLLDVAHFESLEKIASSDGPLQEIVRELAERALVESRDNVTVAMLEVD